MSHQLDKCHSIDAVTFVYSWCDIEIGVILNRIPNVLNIINTTSTCDDNHEIEKITTRCFSQVDQDEGIQWGIGVTFVVGVAFTVYNVQNYVVVDVTLVVKNVWCLGMCDVLQTSDMFDKKCHINHNMLLHIIHYKCHTNHKCCTYMYALFMNSFIPKGQPRYQLDKHWINWYNKPSNGCTKKWYFISGPIYGRMQID